MLSVLVWLVISGMYLFHLIVLLNLDFNCSRKLLSSSVDEVTTGTYNFVSVIWNVALVGEVSHRVFVIALFSMLVITHSLDQVKIKTLHN